MKHLMKFNESINKDIRDIDDMLLQFKDTGELDRYIIRLSNDSKYAITPIFSDSIYGFDKIKLTDKIINRLKRKFKYIYINYEEILIDIYDNKKNYINYSLYDKIMKILSCLDNAKEFKYENRNEDLRFWGLQKGNDIIDDELNKDNIVVMYDIISHKLWINTILWNMVRDTDILHHTDVNVIFEKYVSNKFKIPIYKAYFLSENNYQNL